MPTWLIALDRHFPIRYLTLLIVGLMLAGGGLAWPALLRKLDRLDPGFRS